MRSDWRIRASHALRGWHQAIAELVHFGGGHERAHRRHRTHPFDRLRAGSCKERKDGAPSFVAALRKSRLSPPPIALLTIVASEAQLIVVI
jgi:hypothetical protein